MLAWFGRHRLTVSGVVIAIGVILFYSLARYN